MMTDIDRDNLNLEEARLAFDLGDHARGGKIVHGILKREITNAEAWSLLYTYIGRGKNFDEFQESFVHAYYPNKYDEFVAKRNLLNHSPYRRVSLARSKANERDTQTGKLDFPRPKTGPAPASRRIGVVEQKRSRFKLPGLFKRRKKKLKKKSAERDATPPQKNSLFSGFRHLFNRKAAPVAAISPEALEQKISLALPVTSSGDTEAIVPQPKVAVESVQPDAIINALNKERKKAPPPDAEEKSKNKPLLSSLGQRSEIRIVIADDIEKMRENIRKLLLFEPSIEVVGVAASGREAVDLALETQPDVVLLDINMPDMDGLQALKILRENLPLTQVIMLTVQDDPGYLREALQLGARDYLIKPPMIDDLLNTIRQSFEFGNAEKGRLERLDKPPVTTLEESTRQTHGSSIAVYSPKGGVGCSMLTANLAVALRETEESVVVVDCNLQYGGIGLLFNEAVRTSVADLAAFANELDSEVVKNASIVHEDSGVNLLLAPNRLGKGEYVNGEQVSELVRFLTKIFSYVLVDTSSLLDDLTIGVLEAADKVLLVTTQDIPSINDIRRVLDLAPSIGVEPDKISLVLNQYHSRISITPEKISSNLGREVASVIPLDSPTVVPSINRGVPFMNAKQFQSRPIGVAIQGLAMKLVSVTEVIES